jgi:hypothetical protein
MSVSNPFFYGNPVSPDQFIGRERAVRRVVGRILNHGQSTAVVGEPRSGKTSLLEYLRAPETREDLYGAHGERLLFSYLNSQMLGSEFTQAQFWKYVLQPLRVKITDVSSPLAQAYRTCREDNFGTFVVERLLAQMRKADWRLVLLLDEFDALLHHEVLNSTEFFGGLRSLASRSRSALALVIASRSPLTLLNKNTQELSRTGSPYFNFLDEITLGPWFNKEATELLNRGGDRFTAADRRYIAKLAGGHPYLLQAAASELWEAYSEGSDDTGEHWQQTGRGLYDNAAMILSDTWRLWPSATRKAFTAVALADVADMLEEREFFERPLIRDVQRDCGRELQELRKRGLVSEDEDSPTGYRVRPQAFLWWLTDEMVRTVRDDRPFEDWLREQEMGVVLTEGEREQLGEAVCTIVGMLKDGSAALIEAAAKGAGKAMVGG